MLELFGKKSGLDEGLTHVSMHSVAHSIKFCGVTSPSISQRLHVN